jgi:ATP-dependent protease HslVU (ClpYQ) peptidase subunit
MTTIVTDGKTIAADSLVTYGHERGAGKVEKIVVRDGRIYALGGLGCMMAALIEWHKAGADPRNTPPCTSEIGWDLIVIDAGGIVRYSSAAPYAAPVHAPWGLGQGAEFALGAIYAGASPKEAVEIACRLSTTSGLPVKVVDIAEALGIGPDRVLWAAE